MMHTNECTQYNDIVYDYSVNESVRV
jgi:hypothetical protein